MITSLQTDKGRELVKEFEGDARSILSKLHHYHTQSNIAQHEIVTLTTYITNLSLTDSWKGTTRQFLSSFKEKLRLLDSLVPDTDKIPETVRITFLQRAVQQNHDLQQIHVLDSVWRSKTGSTGKFTFEVYYDLLWNAAYQHDLNKATKNRERPSFPIKMIQIMILSMILKKTTLQMIKIKMNLHHTQSFNLPSILLHLRNLPKFLFPINSGESSLKLQSRW